MRRSTVSSVVFFGLAFASAAHVEGQEVGPPHGSLVIVGGAMRDTAIVRRFIDLAGGTGANIVVIPTAGGEAEYDQSYPGLRTFRAMGAQHLTVVHTIDRAEADTEAFVAPIEAASEVWFHGGSQWHLADSYLGTRTQKALWGVLERGGVIGGSSAGATIQGSYLARGDTKTNTIMMGDHEVGFGFLKNAAIDQHILRRNRQFDLIEIIDAHPDLLGIGIDENTAIVVQGDRFEVMGASLVAIYDHEKMIGEDGRFYFMAPGDQFDLATRTAYRPARQVVPIDRVEARTWPGRVPR